MHRFLSLYGVSLALGIVGCAQASLAGAPDNDIRQEFEKYYYVAAFLRIRRKLNNF